MQVAIPAYGATATRGNFGTLPDGRKVEAVTLANKRGVSATVIAYGATLQSIIVPDWKGRAADVALGYSSIGEYLADPQYFGATVGRFANRIAGGRFSLDGVAHQLPVNNGPNSLHGGSIGFDKVLWEIVAIRGGDPASVTLRHVSPDGDQGYPGTLTVTATYALADTGELSVEYTATSDRPTIVNLTNHTFWNLSGEGSDTAMDHILTVPAAAYLPVGDDRIPLGEIRNVEATPFDFRSPRVVADGLRSARDVQIRRGRGYDHNWVLGDRPVSQPRLAARLFDPRSGRGFELWSNQPGLQVYTGNFLNGTSIGKSGRAYRQGDGIALEPQGFPDSPNQPGFPSARLNPGATYRHSIRYRFFSVRPN